MGSCKYCAVDDVEDVYKIGRQTCTTCVYKSEMGN
jgi:uncharacterized Fe-S center protein